MEIEKFTVNTGKIEDRLEVILLYRTVAAVLGGLARTSDEITEEYVENFMQKSLKSGIIIVARDREHNQIIGEIHAYALGPKCFAHVLGELTIAVHPEYQSQRVGRAIFTEFMRLVENDRPDILRVELIARESNNKAIKFYQNLGFEIEGRLLKRIRGVNDNYEADIPMAWFRNVPCLSD